MATIPVVCHCVGRFAVRFSTDKLVIRTLAIALLILTEAFITTKAVDVGVAASIATDKVVFRTFSATLLSLVEALIPTGVEVLPTGVQVAETDCTTRDVVWGTGAATLLATLQALIATLPEQCWSSVVQLVASTLTWTWSWAAGDAANRRLASTGSSAGSKPWRTTLRVDLDKTDCCIEPFKVVTSTP